MAGQVTLRVVEGPQRDFARPFDGYARVVVGREPGSAFSGDRSLAPRHFVIEIVPPKARLLDLGSPAGTFVNNRSVGAPAGGDGYADPVELRDGDRIRAGQSVFEVLITEPDPCALCARPIDFADGFGDQALCADCRPTSRRPGDDDATTPAGIEQIAQAFGAGVSPTELKTGDAYQVLSVLGSGGFGTVYLAKDQGTGALTALKLMRPETAGTEAARRRFVREASVALSLEHPNIVGLHDRGCFGPVLFFSMEYCNAGDLRSHLESSKRALTPAEALPIMMDALAGLAFAHLERYVHRDVKPANILLHEEDGRRVAKLGDLGLTKSLIMAGLSGFTLTGETIGTGHFMAPEQFTSFRDVQPTADVWSAGATLFNLLTGEYPRRTVEEGRIRPVRVVNPAVPRALAEVIDTALRVKPADRHVDAGALRAALEQIG